MASLNTATVLQRKVAPSTAPAAAAGQSTPVQALSRVWSRCIADQLPMVVQAIRASASMVSLAEALDTIEADGFAALLGDGAQGFGLFVMDQQGFSAVVEAMTIGRLATRPATQRRATATDAALLATLIDSCFAALPVMDTGGAGSAMAAARFNRQIVDHRLLPILLEECAYDRLVLNGLFVCGAIEREFSVTVLLPQQVEPKPVAGNSAARDDPWGRELEQAVLAAPAQLCAELGRIPISVARLAGLKPGDCLTLPLSALEEIALRDLQGRVLGQGRLGQSRGMRAIRLTSNLGRGGADAAGPVALPDWHDGAEGDSAG